MLSPRTPPVPLQPPPESQIALATQAWAIETSLAEEMQVPLQAGATSGGRTEKTLLGSQLRLREAVRVRGNREQKARMKEADRLRWELVQQLEKLLTRMCRDEESMQTGREGAFRAALIWDPSRGALATVAGWWIRAALMRSRPEGDILRRTGTESDQLMQINRLQREAELSGRTLTPGDLAEGTGLPLERIHFLLRRRTSTLSGEVTISGLDHCRVRLLDVIIDEETSVDEQVSHRIDGKRIREMVERLPARQKEVIQACYSDDAPSLQTIGKQRGLSRERIRQVRNDGLSMLRRLVVEDDTHDLQLLVP